MPKPAYSRSKAAAERIARRFQSDGAPVVTIYPGSVWGPHDPYLGETGRIAQSALRGRLRLLNDGLLPISDARDVAVALAALMEPGRGPRRHLVVGHNPSIRGLIQRMGDLAGRNLWSIPVPTKMALATASAADWTKSRFGINAAINYEGAWLVANGTEIDSTAIANQFGIDFTPLDETLLDTVRSLYESGHITKRQAGTLTTQLPKSNPPKTRH